MSPLRRPWETLPASTVADPFAWPPHGADGAGHDRCDACGALARVHVAVAGGDLVFCWTDYLAHEDVLAARGYAATPCGSAPGRPGAGHTTRSH